AIAEQHRREPEPPPGLPGVFLRCQGFLELDLGGFAAAKPEELLSRLEVASERRTPGWLGHGGEDEAPPLEARRLAHWNQRDVGHHRPVRPDVDTEVGNRPLAAGGTDRQPAHQDVTFPRGVDNGPPRLEPAGIGLAGAAEHVIVQRLPSEASIRPPPRALRQKRNGTKRRSGTERGTEHGREEGPPHRRAWIPPMLA